MWTLHEFVHSSMSISGSWNPVGNLKIDTLLSFNTAHIDLCKITIICILNISWILKKAKCLQRRALFHILEPFYCYILSDEYSSTAIQIICKRKRVKNSLLALTQNINLRLPFEWVPPIKDFIYSMFSKESTTFSNIPGKCSIWSRKTPKSMQIQMMTHAHTACHKEHMFRSFISFTAIEKYSRIPIQWRYHLRMKSNRAVWIVVNWCANILFW